MGMGTASGENRAAEAAQMAMNSPLLEDISISGAKGVLMNITGPSNMTMDEVDEASNLIKGEVNEDAEIFWGVVFDDAMEDDVQVTVVATGINSNGDGYRRARLTDYGNVVNIRDVDPEDTEEEWTVRMNGVSLDTPTFVRKGADISVAMDDDEEAAISRECQDRKSRKTGIFGKFRLKDNLDYPTFLRAKAD
jgi:cell division protein FtsZ